MCVSVRECWKMIYDISAGSQKGGATPAGRGNSPPPPNPFCIWHFHTFMETLASTSKVLESFHRAAAERARETDREREILAARVAMVKLE